MKPQGKIYPSSMYIAYPTGSQGTRSLTHETQGTRQGTGWIGCKSFAVHNRTHTMDNFSDANQPATHVSGVREKIPQGEHANFIHVVEGGIKPPILEV